MSTATLTPAYGRDYTSAKKAREAWESGADFILHDPWSIWDGKPFNIESAAEAGEYSHANIRYARRRKVVRVKL